MKQLGLAILFTFHVCLAADEATLDPRVAQAYEILDDIKSQNPPDHFHLDLRSGLMQVFANSVDAVNLNKQKSIPFIGAESETKIYENLNLEARFYYAQNLLFPIDSSSPNQSSSYQVSYEGGLRYKFILDQTRKEDFIATKLLYNVTSNNFKLSDPNLLYMKEYDGIVTSIERSIPVTPKIVIDASLDVMSIILAKSDSQVNFEPTGIGFSIRGNAYYNVDWFGLHSRIGGAYWQGGFVNRLAPDAQQNLNRTSHVQTFRAMSISYGLEF